MIDFLFFFALLFLICFTVAAVKGNPKPMRDAIGWAAGIVAIFWFASFVKEYTWVIWSVIALAGVVAGLYLAFSEKKKK